eukprot:5422695-Pyramimonas_sp.AAC.1
MLSNISFGGSLMALVVEVAAGDRIEVLASSGAAADSQSFSTAYIHHVDAVAEYNKVGKEVVDGVELGGLR